MSKSGLSRELALRIGLAARSLPEPDLPLLMSVLLDIFGMPLTEQKLNSLNFQQLRNAAAGALERLPRSSLRQALGYLRGSLQATIIEDTPPLLQGYEEGDMPGSVRVAVASEFDESLAGAFSNCQAFLIYQVSAKEVRLIDRRLPDASGKKTGRDASRVVLIDDCHLLYAKSAGNPASALLMRNGIHPIQCAEGGAARSQLAILQSILGNHPPPWLARASGLPRNTVNVAPGSAGRDVQRSILRLTAGVPRSH